jgi:hypothetical protein
VNIPFADSPPAGWFVLDVMRREWRKWDWVALVIDVDPNERRSKCATRSRWVELGKHKNRDDAWDYAEYILEDEGATRH